MRYMGSLADLNNATPPAFLGSGGLDPALKAQAIAYAPFMNDAQQADLLEIADATSAGKRTRLIRYGLGFGLGALAAIYLPRALKKLR